MSQKTSLAVGHFPDASICRVQDIYYMVCSSFQYFPALPIFQSTDLIQWQPICYGLSQIHVNALIPQTKSIHGIRYPTLRHNQGKFYLLATLTEYNQHFLLSTDDPIGSWNTPVQVKGDAQRASLFFDKDNRAYCVFSTGSSASICEINLETGDHLSEETVIWKAEDGHFLHAPHLYHIDDAYTLLATTNQIGGEKLVTLLTSPTINGNYKPDRVQSPLLDQNTGLLLHVDHAIEIIDTADGGQIALYQPFDSNANSHLGSIIHIASLSGDLPSINKADDAELAPDEHRDDFVLPELQLEWQFIRQTPDDSEWSVEDRAGWLRLSGSDHTLNSTETPLFVAHKQRHGQCKIATTIDFEPQRGQEEAGLAIYVDENHHYEIAVTSLSENTRSVIVRRKIGSLSAIVAYENIPLNGLLQLIVSANNWSYNFSYQLLDAEEKQLATGEAHYLSQAVTGLQSGVYFGVYATGNGRKSTTDAFFDWVDYIPIML
ncbi:MAG: family 43 glycosylhydrolase [Aggregatilineales bacterium]